MGLLTHWSNWCQRDRELVPQNGTGDARPPTRWQAVDMGAVRRHGPPVAGHLWLGSQAVGQSEGRTDLARSGSVRLVHTRTAMPLPHVPPGPAVCEHGRWRGPRCSPREEEELQEQGQEGLPNTTPCQLGGKRGQKTCLLPRTGAPAAHVSHGEGMGRRRPGQRAPSHPTGCWSLSVASGRTASGRLSAAPGPALPVAHGHPRCPLRRLIPPLAPTPPPGFEGCVRHLWSARSTRLLERLLPSAVCELVISLPVSPK